MQRRVPHRACGGCRELCDGREVGSASGRVVAGSVVVVVGGGGGGVGGGGVVVGGT